MAGIKEIRIDKEKEPLGMDEKRPVISWSWQEGTKSSQKAYQIIVSCRDEIYWDSQRVEEAASHAVVYEGRDLQPLREYELLLKVWCADGKSYYGKSCFETGFLGESIKAWEGCRWIGPPEYSLFSQALSVFTLSAQIRLKKGSQKAGIIFGAEDDRLLDKNRNELGVGGNHYILVALAIEKEPAQLEIYRVGYTKEDKRDIPFAVIRLLNAEGQALLKGESRYEEHKLTLKVTGNCMLTFWDEVLVDFEEREIFGSRRQVGRQINPLGFNDTTTYPRLCKVGCFVKKGSKALFRDLQIKNNRAPQAVLRTLYEDGICLDAPKEDRFLLTDPSKGSMPMLRFEFAVTQKVKKARLYATARGIYEARINGREITDTYFNPGASQYDKHLYYQVYDIGDFLCPGQNAIGITLSSGWWSDMSTYVLENYNFWGDKPSFLGQILITYQDGSTKRFVTDCDRWQYYGEGPVVYSSFFNGEFYDCSRAWIEKEFSRAGFFIEGLKAPQEIHPLPIEGIKYNSDFAADWPDVNLTEPKLVSCKNAPVRIYEEIAAKTVKELDKGVYLYDLGQEIAGTVKITLNGNSGDKIRIRYGEILYPHKKEYKELAGRMLQVNLREASNTDYVILHNEKEVFCPKFTSHGYRYIEISGTQSPSKPEEVVGCLLSSVREIKGEFVCDNPLINRLVSNISYSMLCNYMSIPTDCPQRNERMGWLGDTHIFAGTATYQADVENFLRRNILAIKDLQREDGRLPNIAPFGGGFGGITYESALILMVYELYLQYGDKTVVEENYQAMSRWMDSMQRAGMPGEVYVGPLGDWLALEETDLHLIWNAFYIRDARYMAYFARLTNKTADVQKYEEIERKSRNFWNAHYVDKEKKITQRADKSPCDTQASYVIGLSCHAFDASLEADMAKRLAKRVEEAEYRLSTGFFATGDLNSILCRFGYEKEAFCLISQTEYPSWLYPVLQGATTVWERWNGYTVKEGFGGNNAMNSFNHYSFGSVLSWLYEDVLGIRRDEQNLAYKSFILSPNCYGFTYAKGQIPTPYGLIESAWEKRGDRLHYRCKVPANSRARIKIADLNQEVEEGEHCFVLKM